VKIAVYCQHVWGVGHLFRMREICLALAHHDLTLITGGPEVEVPLPPRLRRVQLPVLHMDAEKSLVPPAGYSLEETWNRRSDILQRFMHDEAPDVLLIELYPLGRTAFGRELDPVLSAIRGGGLPPCRVYCSVRDILVAKRDPAQYEARVVDTLNHCFDGLLVHADPRVVTLEESFARVADIAVPVVYTGFVARRPPALDRAQLRRTLGIAPEEKLIVASAGGGQSGYPLLAALLAAHRHPAMRDCARLVVFSGPYLAEAQMAALVQAARPDVRLERFGTDFLSWLQAADVSVSMAGYNTCMNLLATRVPALLWPFAGDREQPLRAARLDRMGAAKVLTDDDLQPQHLAAHIAAAKPPRPVPIDLEGAACTAQWIEAHGAHRPRQGRELDPP
jgi:predicted glycosyltransferase